MTGFTVDLFPILADQSELADQKRAPRLSTWTDLKGLISVKAYDNKTAFLKTGLKTVMDPPDGLKFVIFS